MKETSKNIKAQNSMFQTFGRTFVTCGRVF